MHDRYEEARDNLLILHTSEEANIEIAQIQGQMQIDKTLNSSYLNMFKKPSYRKRSFLAIGTTCAIQCSGALVINSKYCLHTFGKYFLTPISHRLWANSEVSLLWCSDKSTDTGFNLDICRAGLWDTEATSSRSRMVYLGLWRRLSGILPC